MLRSFSETYSDSFLRLSAGDLAGELSSLNFLAVRISMIFSEAFFLTGLPPGVSQSSGLLSLLAVCPCHWSPTKSAFLTQFSWLAVNLTGLTSTSELNCLFTRTGASLYESSARLIFTRLGE